MMPGVWTVEKEERIAVLTIDKPPLNLVSIDELIELAERMADLRADGDVRVIVLTGRGKAFIGGTDVSRLRSLDPSSARFTLAAGQKVLRDIEQMEKPTVAAVNGYAFGGGCELAMACDLRICSDNARFGQLEINYGAIPGLAATQRLTRLVGLGRAKELILTGRTVQPLEAMQMGLVSEVVAATELMDTARQLAGLLASKPPIAIALAKELVNASAESSIPLGGAFESAACAIVMGTDDCAEGLEAFTEKREPDFKGK